MDLYILTADGDQKAIFDTLLSSRTRALNIRRLDFRVDKHPQRDPGVYTNGAEFLRSLERSLGFEHALMVLDSEWDGSPGVQAIKQKVLQDVQRLGFFAPIDVVVIEPEVESWFWQNSPHVISALGCDESFEDLKFRLSNYWDPNSPKPHRPKEAFDDARRIPRSSSIFTSAAQQVSLRNCIDPEFNRLKNILTTWFPL